MKKPTKGSSGCLTSEKLFDVLKTRKQWTSLELLNSLMSIYPGYDKEGLGTGFDKSSRFIRKRGFSKGLKREHTLLHR
jgi:hypothetical protein